jgi:DNA-binding SARP family transcriptional activator/TolB-like protein
MDIGEETTEAGARLPPGDEPSALRLRLFGALRVESGGRAVALPPSRKVRALLGYLALAPRPVPRARLCELLWDVASDPRGELRWCLSKLRALVDAPGDPRLITDGERVGLDLSALDIDAVAFARAIEPALTAGSIAELTLLARMVEGELLEGLALERSPLFEQWLSGERQRFQRWQVKALLRLASLLPPGSEEAADALRRRLALTPFDTEAYVDLIEALLAQGARAEAGSLVASGSRVLASEGIDAAPLRRAAGKASAARTGDGASMPLPPPSAACDLVDTSGQPLLRRASIVVMPLAGAAPAEAAIANGLTHDIIFGMAKLRSLRVIARGTAFALRDRALSPGEAAALLGVDYLASGLVRRDGARLAIRVELSAARTGEIIWADEFWIAAQDMLALLGTVTTRIIAGLDSEIHAAERNRALLKPPNSLDAWEAYHRGLWHMFRFTAADNEQSQGYFKRAIALDPTFSSSYAGLSFTHFQNAFLLKEQERQREADLALDAAGRGLMADALDPAAHWALGRALWLRGEDTASVRALGEAVALSPNFAMGHYALSFVQAQSGDPKAAVAAADTSRLLSPFDPMLFAICAAKAFALLRLGEREEAADLSRQVILQPNVHVHGRAIAALTIAAAGRLDAALAEIAVIHRERPGYDVTQFLHAFRLGSDLEAIYRQAARLIGVG